MLHSDSIILPCNLRNWKHVIKYIIEINDNYEKLTNISDIINTFRQIRCLAEGSAFTNGFQDPFLGFGIFLHKYTCDELQYFIKQYLRQIFIYVQLLDSFIDHNIVTLSFTNNVVKLSFAAVKSLLACSILCLIPRQFNNCIGGFSDTIFNFNFDEFFRGIHFGSKNHTQLFHSVLQYFATDSTDLLEKEMKTFITFSINRIDSCPPLINENIKLWPIILTSDLSNTRINTETTENVWPMCYENINPSNYSNYLKFKSDRSLFSVCPFVVIILPILTIGSTDFNISCVLNIDFDGVNHTIYRILPLDPWNPNPQFSMEYIENNYLNCSMAFQFMMAKYLSNGSSFAGNLTDSVIEDAIHKLNKSRDLFGANRSFSNTLDSRRIERPSLSNIFFNPRRNRDASLSSNSTTSRSARQSYSTSSSSRSGSLQLSTLSSRRSSNNSANKDLDFGNNIGDKPEFTGHSFHPIILEESNIQVDDDECILLPHQPDNQFTLLSDYPITDSQFDEMMSAPISDSTKLSLSKDYLQLIEEKCPELSISYRRRNSSPAISNVISKETTKETILKVNNTIRCCEEDASNNRLSPIEWSRSKCQGRRQSLPCHLQWLYQLPLTDSIKLNLSQSQLITQSQSQLITQSIGDDNIEMKKQVTNDWSNKFIEMCLSDCYQVIQTKLLRYADQILLQILPNEDNKNDQVELRQELLNLKNSRSTSSLECSINQGAVLTFKESLQTKDLASFDKELFSSTFFDDEALEYFRNFSNLNGGDNHYEIDYSICKDEIIPGGIIVSKKESLINYVNHLTHVIIAEAIVEETNFTNISYIVPISKYADAISVDIIAGSLVELSTRKKVDLTRIPPIYMGSYPFCYHIEIGILIQILSASLSQYNSGCQLIVVCNNAGHPAVDEIIDIISQNKDRITPFNLYNIMLQYFTDSTLMNQLTFKNFLSKILYE